MKIAIVGPLSFSSISELSQYTDIIPEKAKKGFHTYPWILNLAIGLVSLPGNEVHIIAPSNLITKNTNFVFKRIHFHIFKAHNSLLNFLTFFMLEILNIIKILKKVKPDIVHGQHRSFHSIAAILYSKKHVITNHGNIFEHINAMFKNYPFKKFSNILYYKLLYYSTFQIVTAILARKIIAVSQSCISSSSFKKKQVIINNPINLAFFQNNWTRPESPVILFVGTLTNLKRPHFLLEYISKRKNVLLKCVTQLSFTDEYNKKIKEFIKNENLSERVIFSDFMTPENLSVTMSSSSVLCLPSTYESFGMVLAEAMAVGCPVIGSNVGGIPEVITNDKTGLLFNAEDKNDLFQKLDSVIFDIGLSSKLSEAAKKEALKRWHPTQVALQTINIYSSILSINN